MIDYANKIREMANKNSSEINTMCANHFEKETSRLSSMSKEELLKSPEQCYLYAHIVLNDSRFELGEKTISKSAYYSNMYAKNIIKGRFRMGEKAISKDELASSCYTRRFLS